MPVASVEQRRAALLGYVYAPFRAYDMMQAIFRDDLRDADIELHDLHESPQTLLYASAERNAAAHYVVTHAVEVAGANGWSASAARRPSRPTTRARNPP